MSKNNNLVELLKNASFLRWLKKEDGVEESAHWNKWQQEHPENAQFVEDAKMMELGIPFKKQSINQAKTKANWDKLGTKLQNATSTTEPSIPLHKLQSTRRNWLKIAATIAVVAFSFLGISTYLNKVERIQYQTGYAENQTIQLSDGTQIILAANSTLAYNDNFVELDNRKVQLSGEAYFKVAAQPTGKQFIVELKDLAVTVIGTEFNVNSHRENSIISLVEGKVTLNKEGVAEQPLLAGQTASFNTQTAVFDLVNNQTDYWADWRYQKWSFGEGTPMKEVIQRIEETFGLTVELENTTILEKQASGSIEIDNQKVLFESLSYLLNIDFSINGSQLFISQKVENEE